MRGRTNQTKVTSCVPEVLEVDILWPRWVARIGMGVAGRKLTHARGGSTTRRRGRDGARMDAVCAAATVSAALDGGRACGRRHSAPLVRRRAAARGHGGMLAGWGLEDGGLYLRGRERGALSTVVGRQHPIVEMASCSPPFRKYKCDLTVHTLKVNFSQLV